MHTSLFSRIGLIVGLMALLAACTPAAKPTPDSDVALGPCTTYDNSSVHVCVPTGWTVAETNRSDDSVNITNGNYILYINPNASQASGAEGGRFAEIAQGAKGSDLVLTMYPMDPCGSAEDEYFNSAVLLRHYYMGRKDRTDFCNVPSGDKTVWYFSYLTTNRDPANPSAYGYFGDPSMLGAAADAEHLRQFVVTMTYNAPDIDSLPVKGSPELTQMLGEMSDMAKTIRFK